jgi:hypothetical protein
LLSSGSRAGNIAGTFPGEDQKEWIKEPLEIGQVARFSEGRQSEHQTAHAGLLAGVPFGTSKSATLKATRSPKATPDYYLAAFLAELRKVRVPTGVNVTRCARRMVHGC